jgi:hypothetical protein
VATRTTQSLITDLVNEVGGSVRSEQFAQLARLAIAKAIDHGPYYNMREEVWQDLTGITVVNPQDSKRFALVGRNVIPNPPAKQHLVYGMELTYDHVSLYRPRVNDLEPGINVAGATDPLVTTLSFELPVAAGRIVRFWYRRAAIKPTGDTAVIPLDDAYLERASKMFFHELLSSRQIGGDSTNHAYQAQQLAKQLLALKRARPAVKINWRLWRPD